MTQLIIICCYLGLLLALGMFSGLSFRGTKSDYLLASHSIGPFLLLMSLFGTTMTAFALVGSTGEAYQEGIGVYGMLASSSGIIHSLCFFVIGVKLWTFGRKYGYTTQIQFFRDRLENNGVGLILFPILVGLVIPYLLIGVLAGGAVINKMTSGALPSVFPAAGLANGAIPPWLGSLAICVVVLIYVFFGGMRGTAWANAFQTIVFMILGVVTFYVVAYELGGKSTLLANLQECSASVARDKITRGEMSKTVFFTYLLVPLSVGMFPHLFQHWLTAKSAASFKLPVVCHPIFIMIVWVPCVLIGVWATSPLVGIPPTIKPNGVLAFLVNRETGPVLSGLLTAGILAAIMSSLDSQFLCLGTMFSNDIVTHYTGSDRFSDHQQVWIARGFIVAIVAITYLCSLLNPVNVFDMGVWCFSGFASLFPLAFAAIYWKRLTAAGAYASILTTALVWGFLFWQSDFGARDYTVTIPGTDYQTLPVAMIFLCSAAALVVVSLITPPPSQRTLVKFFDS